MIVRKDTPNAVMTIARQVGNAGERLNIVRYRTNRHCTF